jgi:penicillin-binding protein 2
MEKKKRTPEFWRYAAFLIVLFGIFIWLVSGLINLQLKQSEEYAEKAVDTRTKTIALRGKRGNITTSDSVVMAEDELIYNVTFQKDATDNTKELYQKYTASILETIDIVEKNGGTIAVTFVIERDPETGEWVFNFGSGVSESVLETRESQWRSNNYLTRMDRYGTADQCIEKLKDRYQIPDNVSEENMLKIMAIYSEMQMNIFNSQPIVIAKDVRYETVIEIETRSMMLPGMSVEIGTKRVYPRSNLASQIIGYTGAIPTRAMWLTLQAKGYSYNDTIGRDGVESSMEDWLTQNSSLRKGSRVVERDQMSRVVREISYTAPQDGNNVKLTLNAAYQQQAERCIKENVRIVRDNQEKKLASESWLEANKNDIHNRDWVKYPLALAEHGCLIVLDMQCRVLALANYPTYDLNALVAGGKNAMAILGDARNLLLNYGIHARGTPGSIFKMVTGMGALSSGELKITERISDMGYYTKYNQDLSTAPKCWINKNYRWQHANQTIVEGLTNSCNYFFYELSSRLGEERLYRYASLFGLTSKTGIDLPGEVRSVVGSQNTLYDPSKPVNEANQDTSLPIIVFNSIKKHLRNCGASRNIEYDDQRLSVCAKRLMDMAVNYNESEWLENMRTILMEELNMTKEMVYLQSVIGDTYNYMNDIKWGGGQTILTGIGQSVTVLTPIAVARYVCTVANNGYLYNVSLIDSITSPEGEILSQREPTLIHRLEHSDEYLPYIREGMKGVVDESGTAKKYFRNWPYQDQIAAKTGTAQVTSIDLENNAWFVCFAPYENPEIAVACFIPNGYSGSESSIAPRDFIEWYMEQKTLRGVEITLPVGNSLSP